MTNRLLGLLLLGLIIVTGNMGAAAQEFEGIRARVKDSILFVQAVVRNRDGTNEHIADLASGFIVTCRGHFLTAAHVIQPLNQNEEVKYYASPGPRDNRRLLLEFIKSDPQLDIALFQLPPSQTWIPLLIATSASVPDDAKLIVFGFSNGGDLASSQGTIRNHFARGGRFNTQLPLNHGDSGAPAFDIAGRVIGMAEGGFDARNNVTIITPSDYFQPLLALTGLSSAQDCISTSTPIPASLKAFPFSFTVNSEDSREFSEVFCVNENMRIGRAEVSIDSQNGNGTHLISALTIAERPNCVTLRAYVAGNGVDRIGSIIVNSRGRGWLSGSVNVTTN